MGIFDNLTPPVKKRKCYLVVKADELKLSDADRKTLFALLEDTNAWSASALTAALKQRGFEVSRGVIDRHRAQDCACYAK